MELHVTRINPDDLSEYDRISSLGMFDVKGKQVNVSRCVYDSHAGWLFSYQPGGTYFVSVVDILTIINEIETGKPPATTKVFERPE